MIRRIASRSRQRLGLAVVPLVFGVGLFAVASHWKADFDPAAPEAAGGPDRVITSRFEGRQISFWSPTRAGYETFRQLAAEGRKVVLWTGGSHLHTVMSAQPDSEITAYYANRVARQHGANYRYLQHSLPNANINEMLYLVLSYLQQGLKPAVVVAGLVYDDLDDFNGVRKELDVMPVHLGGDLERRLGSGIDNLRQALSEDRGRYQEVDNTKPTYPEDSPFTWLEGHLTDGFRAVWPAWEDRDSLRAWLIYRFRMLQKDGFVWIRSLLRGGHRTSEVKIARREPVRDSIKEWNLTALDSLIRLCRQEGIQLLLYRAPNPEVTPEHGEFKYDRAAFERTFDRIAGKADRLDGLYYADLEKLIPWEDWISHRYAGPYVDFFHFAEAGHRRLGPAVDAIVADLMDRAR